jgi:hypothetical protein
MGEMAEQNIWDSEMSDWEGREPVQGDEHWTFVRKLQGMPDAVVPADARMSSAREELDNNPMGGKA